MNDTAKVRARYLELIDMQYQRNFCRLNLESRKNYPEKFLKQATHMQRASGEKLPISESNFLQLEPPGLSLIHI